MNRLLTYPALACALVFLALYGSIVQSTNARGYKQPASDGNAPPIAKSEIGSVAVDGAKKTRLDRAAAEKLIQDQLLLPWSMSSIPRHRLFSRAAPRLPSTQTEFHLVEQTGDYFLANARLSRGDKSQTHRVPIVVDRSSRTMYVFADDRWQNHVQWIHKLQSFQVDESRLIVDFRTANSQSE